MLLNENLIKLIPDKKLRNKLRSSFQYKIFNAKKSKEKIIMTILAKNEIDVIEENIKFHLKQGIDFIIATDHNSTDGTKEVFKKYQEKGVLHLIEEQNPDYEQAKFVDRMIKLAKEQYNADWVINADADEFWYSSHNDFKKDIEKLKNYNIAIVPMFNIFPEAKSLEDDEKFYYNTRGILSEQNTSSFKYTSKCMLRTKDYESIAQGNYNAKMHNKRAIVYGDITIFHYGIRTYKQFENKVLKGHIALQNQGKEIGAHWREFYKAYEEGRLFEVYENFLKINYSGNSFSDSRLKDFIENGYESISTILASK